MIGFHIVVLLLLLLLLLLVFHVAVFIFFSSFDVLRLVLSGPAGKPSLRSASQKASVASLQGMTGFGLVDKGHEPAANEMTDFLPAAKHRARKVGPKVGSRHDFGHQ
eukprot:EG_transcript_55610